ncbi:MAG TPA: hypothetical protein VIV55_10050 [Flavobacterium sp.]
MKQQRDPGDPDPEEKKVYVKKGKGGARSVVTTTTTKTPGTPSTTIKGKPGTPAVLATPGKKGGADFNRQYGEAVKSGKKLFSYNGKLIKIEASGTKGRPATNATPDIVTPGTPPSSVTTIEEKPIASKIFDVKATRGTIGGGLRPGIGGGITTNSQITANQDVAKQALESQKNYNSNLDKKYAPDTRNDRGLNAAQLKKKNDAAELRRKQLKGSAEAKEVDVQSGLERSKVAEMKNNKK